MRETVLELLSESDPQKFTTIRDRMIESFGSFDERQLYRATHRLVELEMVAVDRSTDDEPDSDGNVFGVGYLRTKKGTRVLRDLTATPCTAQCVSDIVDDAESERDIEYRFSNPGYAISGRNLG